MKKITLAQEIYMLLGVHDLQLIAHRYRTRSKTATKQGPGRLHAQGFSKKTR